MNQFGFIRATDPLTVPSSYSSFIRATVSGVSPNTMPENIPDGPPIMLLDGSTGFSKKGSFSIHYEGLYIADAVAMYNEYVAAASETNALVWVRWFNKKNATWETVLATIQPITINETEAQVYKSVEIRFDGVGVNTAYTGFVPGQQNPPTSSGGITGALGRPYGRGAYGVGVFGHG